MHSFGRRALVDGHPVLSPSVALALRYSAFAGIATAANLIAQRAVLGLGAPLGRFWIALAVGTVAGLVVKYLLDKRWIFADSSTGFRAHGRRFSLYTLMGVATTAIFWMAETAAWLIWQTHFAREAGALAGLAIGYAVKYRLDRRFVFNPEARESAG